MRTTTLKLRTNDEVKACIRAATDYFQMTEDMRKEPASKLGSLNGAAFDEALNEINSMNILIVTGKQLVERLKALPPLTNTDVEFYLNSAETTVLTAGLEMDVESCSEMEPFYRLLYNAPKGAGVMFTRETIEKVKDEVEEGIASLVAMKDVLARLK